MRQLDRPHSSRWLRLLAVIGCSVLTVITPIFIILIFVEILSEISGYGFERPLPGILMMLPLFLGAILGTLLASSLAWWLYLRFLCHRDGSIIGVIVSLVAHPLMWIFYVWWSIREGGDAAIFSSSDGITIFIWNYTMYSLFSVGWITTPIGGIVGHFLGKMLKNGHA
jgi:hypothetical protein